MGRTLFVALTRLTAWAATTRENFRAASGPRAIVVAVMFQRKRAGAVCDEVGSRPAVAAIMERCGFRVAVLQGPVSELVAETRLLSPQLVVFDLASAGSRGLRVVKDLQGAAPGCTVVLLAPFDGLRESALAVGAYELTGKDDLRDLERCLRRLTAELDARSSAGRGLQPGFWANSASQRKRQQETLPVVGQITPGTTSEPSCDRQA